MARILIAGCGYVGSALGERLLADSDTVWGLRRGPGLLPSGIRPIEADLAVSATLRDLPGDLDVVVYAASPGGRDDAHYRTAYVEGACRLLEALESRDQRPQRFFFVSSTAVYVQSSGEWVDEDSPTQPEHFSGRRLLEAERLVVAGPYPSTIVRLGGIYGPRRTRMLDQVRTGRAVYAPGRPRFTNRIHRDDCAGALHHLIRLSEPESLYLGVDGEPVEEATMMRWVAGAVGAPSPRMARGPEAKSLRARSNKRCRNDRLLASGYTFEYPSFREGYAALIADLR
jgi:nucleoside-diphosphate-sugar epimerase